MVDKNMTADQIIRKVTVYDKTATAPIEKGDVYGKVELFVNVDQKIGEVDLVASQTLERSDLMHTWNQIVNTLGTALPIILIAVGVLAVLIVAYVIFAINHNRRRRNNYKLRK